MSMMTCPVCNNQISGAADKCPCCGSRPSLRRLGRFAMALIAISIVVGVLQPKATTGPGFKKSSDDVYEDHRINVARSLERYLEAMMRDPESLKIEVMQVEKHGQIVCAIYRARNGFGGMNRDLVVKVGADMLQGEEAWQKHCVSGDLHDMLWAVSKRA